MCWLPPAGSPVSARARTTASSPTGSNEGVQRENMKLNLGCGGQILDGWVNVDKFGKPDQVFDLESFPWPWADNSVDEILLSHVLEHLGQSPQVFIAIMRELYRVCRDGATLHIRV